MIQRSSQVSQREAKYQRSLTAYGRLFVVSAVVFVALRLICVSRREHSHDERGRVALLLAGQLRTLSEPEVLGNLRIAILEALRPDVFLSVSRSHTYSWQIDHYEGLEDLAPTNASQLRKILRVLNPVKVSVSKDEVIGLDRITRRVPMAYTFLRFKQLLDMMLHHEASSGFHYEWVIRVRPDLVYACSFKSLLYQAALGKKVYMQWDYIAIMSREAAPLALNLVFEADQFMPCFVFQAELCLQAILWKYRIPYFDANFATIWIPVTYKLKVTHVSCNSNVILTKKKDLQNCVFGKHPMNFTYESQSYVEPILRENASFWAHTQLRKSLQW
jgi:hypothetical protein